MTNGTVFRYDLTPAKMIFPPMYVSANVRVSTLRLFPTFSLKNLDMTSRGTHCQQRTQENSFAMPQMMRVQLHATKSSHVKRLVLRSVAYFCTGRRMHVYMYSIYNNDIGLTNALHLFHSYTSPFCNVWLLEVVIAGWKLLLLLYSDSWHFKSSLRYA